VDSLSGFCSVPWSAKGWSTFPANPGGFGGGVGGGGLFPKVTDSHAYFFHGSCNIHVHLACKPDGEKIECPPKPGTARLKPTPPKDPKKKREKLPDSADSCLQSANVYADTAQIPRLTAMLDAATKKFGDAIPLRVRQIEALLASNKPDEASVMYSELMFRAPTHADTLMLQAACHRERGDEQMLDSLERVLEAFPDHSYANLLIGPLRTRFPQAAVTRQKAQEREASKFKAEHGSSTDLLSGLTQASPGVPTAARSGLGAAEVFAAIEQTFREDTNPQWVRLHRILSQGGVSQVLAVSVLLFPGIPLEVSRIPTGSWEKVVSWLRIFPDKPRAFSWILEIAQRRDFFGFQTPGEAVTLLATMEPGAFLLRMSSQPGQLTLSCKADSTVVDHKRVTLKASPTGDLNVGVADAPGAPEFNGVGALDLLLNHGKVNTLYAGKNIMLTQSASRDDAFFVEEQIEDLYGMTPSTDAQAQSGAAPALDNFYGTTPSEVAAGPGAPPQQFAAIEGLYGTTPAVVAAPSSAGAGAGAGAPVENYYGSTPANLPVQGTGRVENFYGNTPAVVGGGSGSGSPMENLYGNTPAVVGAAPSPAVPVVNQGSGAAAAPMQNHYGNPFHG
jgi:SH2 domain